jgi:hypothetical protein
MNVGVLLGDPSGGLVDVDLDCEQALLVAEQFLPPTGAVFGRPGRPNSHHLYVAPAIEKTQQLRDVDGAMILELRSTGGQMRGCTITDGLRVTISDGRSSGRGRVGT